MNRAEIEAEAAAYCELEGWNNVSPSPDWQGYVKEALRLFSWEAEYVRATTTITMVQNQAEYPLTTPPDWKLILGAVGGTTRQIRIVDEARVRADDPLYFMRPAGTPQVLWLSKPNIVQVHKKPDSAGEVITLYGVTSDTDMANATSSPGCPLIYHRAVALWAAFLHANKYAEGEARQRALSWLAQAKEMAVDCRAYYAGQASLNIQRRVKRRAPQYLYLTGNLPPAVGG